jgi:hypothetical protein
MQKEPHRPAKDMHLTATIEYMGVIAMKLQRKQHRDPATELVVNDPEGNIIRSREERDPCKLEKLGSV